MTSTFMIFYHPNSFTVCPQVNSNFGQGGIFYAHFHPQLKTTTEAVDLYVMNRDKDEAIRTIQKALLVVEKCSQEFAKERAKGTFSTHQISSLDKEEEDHKKLSEYLRERVKALGGSI